MEITPAFWGEWMDTWTQMLVHPLWLAAILLAAWQFAWKSLQEEQRYGGKLNPPTPLFLQSLAWGIAAGWLLTPLLLTLPLSIQWNELFWVWGVALFLCCIRLRFACFAYSAGLLSLVSLTWQSMGEPVPAGAGGVVWNALYHFSVSDWMAVVVALHLAEWWLVRVDGQQGGTPVTAKDPHNEILGGYRLQKVWPLPLFIPSPVGVIPLPVLTGFARINLSRPPEQQKRRSSSLILLFALILLSLVVTARWWEPLLWLTAAFSVIGHEALYLLGRHREKKRFPLYGAVPDGVKIWVVLPGTPADSMGLKPGDVLLRVNGQPTRSGPELKAAIRRSAAFAKLELKDEQGEAKLAQCPVYEGDPPLLGIVPAPESDFAAQKAAKKENPAMPSVDPTL
ncbi:PDZ domain-containing protein [Desmospora profundinema]|uniref:PDZ domain-containing protein n=1 Tax=Desmospora profundinema TaxID=1571184 RepID=A0ABU1ILJ0_9BACL|nr:PDZ domain-containing protein [Desmospora profundinema]MDR6225608.1 hypothetical protein [Desmospora profundinema]